MVNKDPIKLYPSKVFHARFGPRDHQFSYQTLYHLFELDRIDEISRVSWLYGYNRFSLFSIYSKDYLERGDARLHDKVLRLLGTPPAQIQLLTCPRFLGYVFNPVSFFMGLSESGALQSVVVEINNTFKEKHCYVLEDLQSSSEKGFLESRRQKDFHVSPFYDKNMSYRFLFKPIQDSFEIRIILERDNKPIFFSNLVGKQKQFSSWNILKQVARAPWIPAVTMLRILWQAGVLHYWKRLPVHPKPYPDSLDTLRSDPKRLRDRLAMRFLIRNFFSKLRSGFLEIELPDRRRLEFGDPKSTRRAQMRVRSYRFFWRCLWSADVGFGESFVDHDWDTPDLPKLLGFFIDHHVELNDHQAWWAFVGRFLNRVRHATRFNSKKGARKNIFEHYDLGNDFYSLFLDQRRQYSCGLFLNALDDLATAQKNKIDSLIRKAQITADDHVLEIGCGWGGLAIECVRQTGCQYTGITISKAQYDYALQAVEAAGLSQKITLKLMDFRDLKGKFDKILSCEMLEAIGHENLPEFFKVCDRVLKRDGLAVVQVITLPDHRYPVARRKTDWIQKHIFPGSVCPSLQAISQAMTISSDLMIESLENIGPHYAPTLRQWRERFLESANEIRALGFTDEFIRKWIYYFSYCEAGFYKRVTNDLQLVLTRPNNKKLGAR